MQKVKYYLVKKYYTIAGITDKFILGKKLRLNCKKNLYKNSLIILPYEFLYCK